MLKEDALIKLLRGTAQSYGWKLSDPQRREGWERLGKLAKELTDKNFTYKAVADGVDHAKEIHPDYFPPDPLLIKCIRTRHEEEEKRKRVNKRTLTLPENYERWKRKMVQCGVWNSNHHEELMANKVRPKMADPGIAYGEFKNLDI